MSCKQYQRNITAKCFKDLRFRKFSNIIIKIFVWNYFLKRSNDCWWNVCQNNQFLLVHFTWFHMYYYIFG